MQTQKKIALTAVAAMLIGAAAALPAIGSDAHSAAKQDVTVREKVRGLKFVRHAKSTKGDKLAMGDRVVTRQALFDTSNHPTGTLYTDCVNTGGKTAVFKATLQCTTTYRLAGGQIVVVGVIRLGTPSTTAAIVGGTGAYAGASGTVSAAPPVKGYDSVDVLHID